jgi:Holliday junction resolvasome RuvABC ATP-dependent DNA helicase subunit
MLLAKKRPNAESYARAIAELAIAAASIGELTINALGTATILGNAQLTAASVQLPTPVGRLSGAENTPSQTPAAVPSEDEEPLPTLDELLAQLDDLVGLEAVKSEVRHQTQVLRIEGLRRAAGLKVPDMTRHLVFVGNPGTGKTTVARLVAGIYRASGVLPKGHLVECDRSSLVAGYLGQTAIKTQEMITKALGGALFVDEAYALAGDEYGGEAIDTIVKAMEDHRDELLVIIAGYPGPMSVLIASNPGLESRFRLTLEFADYRDDELVEIFCKLAAASDFSPTDDTLTRLRAILAGTPRGEGFGNGRFVRTMFESAVVRQAWRLRENPSPDVEQLRELMPEDLADPIEPPPNAPPVPPVDITQPLSEA